MFVVVVEESRSARAAVDDVPRALVSQPQLTNDTL
jgi:hypothetical protein